MLVLVRVLPYVVMEIVRVMKPMMIAQKIFVTILGQVNAQQQALMLPLSLAKGASLPPWVQTALQSAAPVPDTPAT